LTPPWEEFELEIDKGVDRPGIEGI